MPNYTTKNFPKSRIATIDIGEIGRNKHHITALLEVDVTQSREKIRNYRKSNSNISLNAWLIKTIGHTINNHKDVGAYLTGKQKLFIFNSINVSFLVEKEVNGQKVPIPLVIENVAERSIESITNQINNSKNASLSENEIVLNSKTTRAEKLYYKLPGFIRRYAWRYLLKHPKLVFSKMGNVAVTSIGMMGKVNGWFIPISIHPICFGIGSIVKKPLVVNDEIVIKEILYLTVLIDHDVVDGAPMARFISELTKNIEKGILF